MSQHNLYHLPFTSLTSERWGSLPAMETIKLQIASAAIAHCEVSEHTFGLYSPPDEIRDLHLTAAAADQIRCMWHGHRENDKKSPPVVPLKLFVVGFGQANGHTWADIEVHPGLDDWESPK